MGSGTSELKVTTWGTTECIHRRCRYCTRRN